jgi:hypothetical protein
MLKPTQKGRSPQASTGEPAATPEQTLEALIGPIRREYLPIRSAFLQEYAGERAPGPMHLFVGDRQRLALQLYLLLRCVALGGEFDRRLPNGAWARALGLTSRNAEQSISRCWAWLRKQKLVRTERDHRVLRAYVLDEAGTGGPYTRPERRFFKLPMEYFRGGYHINLDLPSTATLLIALYLGRGGGWWGLPAEQAPVRYGISADTLQRGFDGLAGLKLLERRYRRKTDALSRYGRTQIAEFQLLGDFATGPREPEGEDGS